MAVHAAKAPEPTSQQPNFPLSSETTTPNLPSNLQIWKEVVIAEILNLMEKRRYDIVR